MANTKSIDLELGSSQYGYITDANQTGLDFTDDFTLEAWVKTESQPGEWPDGRTIISKESALAGYSMLYWKTGTTYILDFIVGTGSAIKEYAYTSQSPILPNGEWVHVALVLDASTKAEIYINGLSIWSSTTSIGGVAGNASGFAVGARAPNFNMYWDGLVDEVRVWNDLRTAAEIAANYQTELVGNEAGLVAYYKFNDSALDETTNNNDLTLVNSPVYSTDIPSWPPLTAIKAVSGVVYASISKITGVAIASVKKVIGLS